MIEQAKQTPSTTDVDALVEYLHRAGRWAWHVFDHRVSGIARDLAWALANLARDHDPDLSSPWMSDQASQAERLTQALDLAADIARLIRKADKLQPHLIRKEEAGQ